MTAMPDRHDGGSLRVSHHGFHVGYARGVRELERWVDLGRAGGGLKAVSAPARVSGRLAAGTCGPAPTPPHPAGNPCRAGRRWWSRRSGRSRFPPRRREDRAGKRGQRCCRGSRRDRKLAVSPLERRLAPSPGHGPVRSEVHPAGGQCRRAGRLCCSRAGTGLAGRTRLCRADIQRTRKTGKTDVG